MERIVHLREGQTRPNQVQKDAAELIRLAEATPEGFTYLDCMAKFGCDRAYVYAVVREARQQLHHEDEYNIVCDPQGAGEPWLYKLVGNWDEAQEWRKNRLGDMLSRAKTVHAVVESVARGLDRRTAAGKAAVTALKHHTRFVEDLGEFVEMFADES